jgi:hypothetical protein
MPISIACPSCKARMTAPDKMAGRVSNCPKCRQALRVPTLPTAVATAEPPAQAPPTASDPWDGIDQETEPRRRRQRSDGVTVAQVLGIAGSLALAVGGVFLPALEMPMLGAVSFRVVNSGDRVPRAAY